MPPKDQTATWLTGLGIGLLGAGVAVADSFSRAHGLPNPVVGLMGLGGLDMNCVIRPAMAHAQNVAFAPCHTSATTISALNAKAGMALAGSALVGTLGVGLLENALEDAKLGGRKLPVERRGEGRVVIDIGQPTGRLRKQGHRQGLKAGGLVSLVEDVRTRRDDCAQDTLIVGNKGSGKTRRAIKPMMKQAFLQDCGALAFDGKGTFNEDVVSIALETGRADSVRIIGFGQHAQAVDLMEEMPPKLASTFVSSLLLLTNEGGSSKIWNSAATLLAEAGLTLLYHLPGRLHYSLPGLYRYLFVQTASEAITNEIVARLAAIRAELMKPTTTERCAELSLIEREMADAEQKMVDHLQLHEEGQQSVKLSLTQLLSKMTPDVEDRFFHKGKKDHNALPFRLEDTYEHGDIFCISAPTNICGTLVSEAIVCFVKQMFYMAMKQRRTNVGANQTRKVVCVCDEVQKYITCSKEDLSDHSFLAESRDTGVFFLWATQSLSALYAQVRDDHMVDALIANFIQFICLASTDKATMDRVIYLLGKTERGRDGTSISRDSNGRAQRSTSTSRNLEDIAHPGLFSSLKPGEAVFIGRIAGDAAVDIVKLAA